MITGCKASKAAWTVAAVLSPSPRSCGERVGVGGSCRKEVAGCNARRAWPLTRNSRYTRISTAPRKGRGEVTVGSNQGHHSLIDELGTQFAADPPCQPALARHA